MSGWTPARRGDARGRWAERPLQPAARRAGAWHARARALAGAALALAWQAAPLADEARPLAQDPALEERLDRLASELRCLVCQNESLADSRTDLAEDLRREIRGLMREGRSDPEVLEFLTARYGDFILYRPPFRSTTWPLWLGPPLILLTAGGGFAFYLRRRARRLATDTRSPGQGAGDAYTLDPNGEPPRP